MSVVDPHNDIRAKRFVNYEVFHQSIDVNLRPGEEGAGKGEEARGETLSDLALSDPFN